jgi:methylation protein EvaC
MTKKKFLDLGTQPLANGFLYKDEIATEYMFNLSVGYDDETGLVSLMEFVDGDKMFNETYPYHTSNSKMMLNYFKDRATTLETLYMPKSILEIGSNDGAFILSCGERASLMCVEPCDNFAEMTAAKGIPTHNKFWTKELASTVGKQDLIYSANCFCHIPDIQEAFEAIEMALAPNGVFVFVDPTLSAMVSRGSYDQIYDEHAHIFSLKALSIMLNKAGLNIVDAYKADVHGGSIEVHAAKADSRKYVNRANINAIRKEELPHITEEALHVFSSRVYDSRVRLLETLHQAKSEGKKVISYGATSKSTTIFNYCGINSHLISCITDTTPSKIGKLSPGMHIPILSPESQMETADIAFLGAWNYLEEIKEKEAAFIERGGIFITHLTESLTVS